MFSINIIMVSENILLMENFTETSQQQKANQFWNTHFHDLLETPINEQYALEVNLWDRLQTTLALQDKDTLRAIALTRIAIPIQSTHMAIQIIRLAKHAINNINKHS